MIRRCVVVGGSGAVGALFAERVRATGARVCLVDPAEPSGGRTPDGAPWVRGDVTAIDDRLAAELGHADLVVLAVPEQVALAALPGVAGALRPDALLVDTLSVKQRFADAVRRHAPRVQAVGLNPMFAPSLGFEGRPVAAVVVGGGPRVAGLLDLVASWGAVIVPVDDREHDRLAGAAQALTHAAVLAFGLALTRLDVTVADLLRIAPPPHRALLSLLARIAGGTPEVYWDVQAANPEAPAVRKVLADALARLTDTVEGGSEGAFEDLVGELRAHLGAELPALGESCAALFEHL
ncbi:prephenate dehydrogenase/arogenate dehydrogenase family protein [Streptomyces fuscigenes]|uniref:prephenate dehydrogenase/arogenate dehydrogenase family protein n=1 Tax=Streptomyces fuscigenes TaxID=1528880 RepID=UPI001F26115A|nr:prephenate dehydrogenase/arogenate dehydrogenase family protein [Streptomyces fuscigenes]MCF3961007.1 prephenate dehydrogenase/arogenate dehydrogenase family protein [Streptomyces fuscigenes]